MKWLFVLLLALAIFGLLAIVFTKTIAARVLVVFGVGALLTLAGMLVAMSRGRLVVQSPDAA